MNLVRASIPVLLTSLLLGCGTNSSSTGGASPAIPPSAPTTTKSLIGMPLAELLSTKYESANLTCRLWTRVRGPLSISDTPNDIASVDLKKDSNFPKVLNLTSHPSEIILNVKIRIADLKILGDSGYSDNFGARYTFKNSPTASLSYLSSTRIYYASGWSKFDGEGTGQLSENIPLAIVSSTSGPKGETFPSVQYVDCTIITKAKPEYQAEWTQLAAGSQTSCLHVDPTTPAPCMIKR